MKPLATLILSCVFFTSCEKAASPVLIETQEAPENSPAPPVVEEAPQASVNPVDFKELTAHLTPQQEKTLKEAVAKATENMDLSLLLQGITGSSNPLLSSSPVVSSEVKILTPEEAKKMGIDLEKLKAGDTQSISINILGDGSLGGDSSGQSQAQLQEIIQSETSVETTQAEMDPELAKRFQSNLEKGDADALAKDLSKIIQNGVDEIAIGKLLGDE